MIQSQILFFSNAYEIVIAHVQNRDVTLKHPGRQITHSCKVIVKKLSDHNTCWYVPTYFVMFFNIMYTKMLQAV